MDELLRIANEQDTCIVLSTRAKYSLLDEAFSKHLLLKAKLIDESSLFPEVSSQYLFFAKREYGYSPAFAEKILPFLEACYYCEMTSNPKMNQIKNFAVDCVNRQIIQFFDPKWKITGKCYYLNGFKPPFLIQSNRILMKDIILNPQVGHVQVSLSNTFEDSLHSVVNDIISLLQNGVSPDLIHVYHVDTKDMLILSFWLSSANIPFIYHHKQKLMEHPIVIEFLRLSKHQCIEEALTDIKDKYNDLLYSTILKKIFDILNRYDYELFDQDKELLEYVFSKEYYEESSLNGVIHLHEGYDFGIPMPGVYYFLLHFVEGKLYLNCQDTDYFSDTEKEWLHCYTSKIDNQNTVKYIQTILLQSENIKCYSYRIEGEIKRELPVLGIEYIIEEGNDSNYDYFKNNYLYQTSNIKPFSHEFHSLDQEFMNRILSDKVFLSQSSISTFIECPFHYLLSKILKLDEDKNSFSLYYGTIVHRMIEQISKGVPFDFKTTSKEFSHLFPEEESYKFEIYNQILETKLLEIAKKLSDFSLYGKEQSLSSELLVQYPIDERFEIIGKIDQLYLIRQDENEGIIIVDYKTGNTKLDITELKDLKQIQLPMYAMMMKHIDSYKNIPLFALFYQQVHVPLRKKEDVLKENDDYMKYDGIVLEQQNLIHKLLNEVPVKSLGIKVDGTLKTSNRIFEKETMEELINQLTRIIDEMIEHIVNGSFPIQPLPRSYSDKKSKSCEFCPYANVCFVRQDHLLDIEEDEVIVDETDQGSATSD